MKTGTKNRQIANAYYNIGLEKARNRDLTGAVAALKRSLRFDKYQTDARNLLGLIYNEIGEVGAALTQWVISLNLQEQDNLAEEYLRKVHAARGYLELADQAAKKYNQALIYAGNDNEDLAVLLLMRMLEEFPQYVKAQELLALLYLHQEDYIKAGRCLYQALKIDRYNPWAQQYMDVTKHNTGKADIEKRKLKNAFSHRQMQDDDIIMPPTYKENTGWQSVLNILVGLLLGAMVIFFLVMPASTESLNAKHNQELKSTLEELNQKNIEIDSLNQQMEAAKDAQSQAEENLKTLQDSSGGTLSQYQNLVKILQAYKDEDQKTAVLLYVDTDWSVLNDGVLNETVAWIQKDMSENGYGVLMNLGDEALTAGDTAGAEAYYQKSLQIKGDNPEVIYKLGMAYVTAGDQETATQYFTDIIMNYPNSDYAEEAKTQRGY